ncbi:MAG: HAMP domain-containing histidine kinase [Pirellulales bacterium]|nr:HAMP domain-containing histidine kinase [Pirellulales bacterium]
MPLRSSLQQSIALAVIMIVLLIVLTVGWILLNVFGAIDKPSFAGWHWTFLSVGTTFIVILVVGVVQYLMLSVKAINLNRRQSNFIDSVTHELKSPIASMKLYLQTLHRHKVNQKQQTAFYDFMLDDLDRLDRLINQMLDTGRLDSEHIDAETEDVLMDKLLIEIANMVCMNYRIPEDTIQWDMKPCVIRANRIDLELIFRNLMDNAIKYAGPKPLVKVTLTPGTNGHAITRIADNGEGIPSHLRRKIFGRFIRLGVELEREKPGTGLGLYIVRTLVKKLHGRIRVRDVTHGSGTVFEVQLPMKA